MAEPKEEKKPAEKGKSSLTPILTGVVAVLGAIVVAIVVFNVVLRPRLTDKPAEKEKEKTKESDIPKHAVVVPFDEAFTTVIMSSPDIPASTLLYKVSLECSNKAAANKVEANKARFTAIIRKMHSYKSRQELDDPLVEQSIEKQIQQEANKVIKELPTPEVKEGGEGEGEGGGAKAAEEDGEEGRISNVFHEKFFVQDM